MARPSGGRGGLVPSPGVKDSPEGVGQTMPMYTEPKGIDRFHASSRVDPQLAVKIRNLMFDDAVLVSRLGTDLLGGEAASPVMQVVDLVRKGKKKVTIRFCTRHLEIYQYRLAAWRSIPVALTGGEEDFFAYTGWADKLLFSNGVDGLWEFDFGTQVAKKVPEGPSAKHLTTFGGRVVACSTVENGTDYPVRVKWTAKNIYTRWKTADEDATLTSDLAGGFEDLYGSPGGITDEAMGVFPFSDEQAWLIRSRSCWQMAVSGNVLAPFRFNRVHPHIGTAFRNSIVSIESGVVFLAREDIYNVHVGGYERIGQVVIDDIVDEITDKSVTLDRAFAAYDVSRQEYRLAVEDLVWRYRFLEQGWTADKYPWVIRSLSRQVQGIAGIPIDLLVGIIDDLPINYPPPPTSINSLVDDRSFDDAMMFVPVPDVDLPRWVVMVEVDDTTDTLRTGESTEAELFLETGVLTLNALKAVELHAVHGEYESRTTQTLDFNVSFDDGVPGSWLPYSLKDIEATNGSEMFMCKSERVSRKVRLQLHSATLGQLRLLGLAPILVLVERSMASRRPKPASISVLPSTLSLNVGGTQQLSWQVLDANGKPITGVSVSFLSSNSSIATVTSGGLVRALAPGSFNIVATVRNIQTTVQGNVIAAAPAPIAAIIVTPQVSQGTVGTTQQFTATIRDSQNNILIGRSVVWSSSTPGFATVNAVGLVTLAGEGVTIISATAEGVTGSATLTVVAAAVVVTTVEVLPAIFSGDVGDQITLVARVKDASDNVLSGKVVTWSSGTPAIATVNATGVVTLVGVGTATITVTSEGKSGISTATVAQAPVASVVVTPLSFVLNAGSTIALSATPRDASGNPLVGRTVTWGSSDVTKATVSGTGVVTAIAAGSVTITASCETKSGTSLGTVTAVVGTSSPLDSPSTVVYVPRPAMFTLPTVFLDSRYNPGGLALAWSADVTLTHVNQATDTSALQAQIDAAATRAGHTRVKLPNGFDATHVRLKNNTLGNFWLYIEAATAPSAEGVRPLTSAFSSAPTITSVDAGGYGCVSCDEGTHHVRLVGIRFKATAGSTVQRLLYLCGTLNTSIDNSDTDASKLPQWIIVDRCWVDGGNVSRCKNGILAHTREFACVDSVIDGVYVTGQENHGINGFNALGPWKIVGNIIEAGSISILLGGADPRITGLQTSDVEIRRNYMYKRPSWNVRNPATYDGIPKVLKNLLELKWGDRVLVEGNVFENCPYSDAGSQRGAFLVWKVENSGGANVTATTSNITYRFNRARNVAGAYEFNGVGVSAGPVGAPLHRVQHQNNIVEGMAADLWVGTGNRPRGFYHNNAAADCVVDHDTLCISQSDTSTQFTAPWMFAGVTDEIRLAVDNSLIMLPISSPPNASNSRSIFGDGSQVVSPDTAINVLNVYAPGWSFQNNVLVKLVGSPTSGYPTTSRYTDTISSVGCVSPGTGNFALASTSPYKGICADGSDPGADMSLVNLATGGVTPPLPVLPGLYGFGTGTKAGRGGVVLRVTNLNDSGTGSLRAAIQDTRPRTVVFEVSGTITLLSKLVVTSPFVTVAGQTAPSPGILIRNYGFSVRTNDVLIQHLRVRVGNSSTAGNNDCMETLGPGSNVVVDHCSLSWATDENGSTWFTGTSTGAHDITLVDCILAENMGSGGFLVGEYTDRFLMLRCLLIHNDDRNIYFKGRTNGVMANCLVYNWGQNPGTYMADPDHLGPNFCSWIGNVYKPGPNTTNVRMQFYATCAAGSKLYVADNSATNVNGGLPPSDPWTLVNNAFGTVGKATAPPVYPDGFSPIPNASVYAAVLNAGAWKTARDSVDIRLIADVNAGTGHLMASETFPGGVSLASVGGFPTISANTRTMEAAGIPDNPNGDDNANGYTNLEEWLQSMSVLVTTPVQIPAGASIQAAVDANPSGTAFNLTGIYRMQTVTPKPGNTFDSATGATLTGARVLTSFTMDGSYYVASGQTQDNADRPDGTGVCRPGSMQCFRPEDLFFDNVMLKHVGTKAEVVDDTTWFFDYAADKIYFLKNPTGKTVETSVTLRAFGGTGAGAYVTIRNLTIEKYANPLQQGAVDPATASGWTIENCEVRFNHGEGVRLGPNVRILNNHIHHQGMVGIGGYGSNCVVQGNEVDYNNTAGVDDEWAAGGIKINGATGVVNDTILFDNNHVHHNDGRGIWCDFNNINITYSNNNVHDNTSWGIEQEISAAAVITNNTLTNNGGGIFISTSRDVEVKNNTISGLYPILGLEENRGVGAWGTMVLINLNVHNNTITIPIGASNGNHVGVIQTNGNNGVFSTANNHFEADTYTLNGVAMPFAWQNAYRTFAQWQAYGNDN